MIHKFSMNGYNIVLDVDGGSVHILDDVAYELVDLYEENTKQEIISKLENKFTAEQIAEAYDEITSLKEEGLKPKEIASKLDIPLRTVYYILNNK